MKLGKIKIPRDFRKTLKHLPLVSKNIIGSVVFLLLLRDTVCFLLNDDNLRESHVALHKRKIRSSHLHIDARMVNQSYINYK